MKTSLLKSGSVFILCSVLIGFYACNEEVVVVEDSKTESPYDRMGRLHNEGLDYVWEQIVATAPLTKSGGRKIPAIDEIRRMCHDFACSKGYGIKTRNAGKEQEFRGDFSFLSEIQQEWLRQIKEVVWTVTPDQVEKFTVSMKALHQQLQQEERISEQEKEILFYTMAVCRYSAQYWSENYEKWQVELYGIDKIATRSLKSKNEEGKYVSKEWWETYKEIVLADGCKGIETSDGYRLEGAITESVRVCLE